jgi:hypothetical protein
MQASRVARPGVIVAAGWLVLLVYAFPGVMTAHSLDYLRQTRTKFFAPDSPPALSALWRWLELVLAGPTAMLIVQSGTFALGAYALLARAMSPVRAAWFTAALLAFPPLLVPLGTIWSTSMMTGLVVLGTAGIIGERRWQRFGGLALLALATAAQPHALYATLPLLLLLWRPRSPAPLARVIAGALLAWIVATTAGLALTRRYTKQPVSLASYVAPGINREWRQVPLRVVDDDLPKLGVPTRTTAVQDAAAATFRAVAAHTPLFSPWLFLALAVALVPLALRDPVALALIISGVMLQLAHRGSVHVIACACLAALLVIARRSAR